MQFYVLCGKNFDLVQIGKKIIQMQLTVNAHALKLYLHPEH